MGGVVSGIWGNTSPHCGGNPDSYPDLALAAIGRCYSLMDQKGNKKPAVTRALGLRWILLDLEMVEAASV